MAKPKKKKGDTKPRRERRQYFNPKKEKGITTGDKKLDFLYNNQWLFNMPIAKNKIRDKAYEFASASGGRSAMNPDEVKDVMDGTYDETLEENAFGHKYDGGATDNSVNLLEQYFYPERNALPKAKHRPTSDYYKFLPSYSIKEGFNRLAGDSIQTYKGNKVSKQDDIIQSLIGEVYDEDSMGEYLGEETKVKLNQFLKDKKTVYGTGEGEGNDRRLGVDLAHYKTGMAWDDRRNLPYVSVSDAWDFSPDHYTEGWAPSEKDDPRRQETKIQATLMHKAGNPFKVYDRFYFDPKTKQYIDETAPSRANIKREVTMANNNNELEEYGRGGLLASFGKGAATGALTGSTVPGLGTLAGGIIGGLGGLFGGILGNRQEKKQEEMLAQQETMLGEQQIQMEPVSVNPTGMINVNNQYAPTFACGGSVKKMATGGVVDTRMVELEDGEVFKTPGGEMGVIKPSAPTHKEGGVPINLEVGTKILGKNPDKETGMEFKEHGREISAMKQKYQKLLESNKGTFTRNAAKAMLDKANKKFDAAYERQDVDVAPSGNELQEFGFGGNIGGFLSGLMPGLKGFMGSGQSALGSIGRDTLPRNLGQSLGVAGGTGTQGAGLGFGQKLGQFFGGLGQSNFGQKAGGFFNTAAQLSPVGYNLAQGMQPADHLNASDYNNPEYGRSMGQFTKGADLMANRRFDVDPLLESNRNAQAIGDYNARNQGGLSAGAVASNRLGNVAQRMRGDQSAYATQNNMNNQYAAQHAGFLGQQAQFGAGMGQQRADTAFNVDNINQQADAARRTQLGAGFGQLSEYAQMQQLMQNQKGSDQQRMQIMEAMEPMFRKWFPNLNA